MEANVHALLFADRVIIENNGKKGLIGVFTSFTFPAFPAQTAPWFVYSVLDNLDKGEYQFTVNVFREPSKQVVFSAGGEFEIEDRSKGMDLILPIPPILLPGDGNYIVEILLDGKVVANRIFRVYLTQPKGE